MTSPPTCDACCGCMSLKIALRIVAVFKILSAIPFFCLGIYLALLPGMIYQDSSVIGPIGYFVAFVEFSCGIMSILLICFAGTPSTVLIISVVMSVFSLIHGVTGIAAAFFLDASNRSFVIGMFVPSALLAFYLTFIAWGMRRREKWEEANPEEAAAEKAAKEAAKNAKKTGGTDVNYGDPVYGQPSQVQSYEMQPQYYGMMAAPPGTDVNYSPGPAVYGQPYQMQAYPDQAYPAQAYPAQPERSTTYGIKAARGGQ